MEDEDTFKRLLRQVNNISITDLNAISTRLDVTLTFHYYNKQCLIITLSDQFFCNPYKRVNNSISLIEQLAFIVSLLRKLIMNDFYQVQLVLVRI